MFQIIDLKYTDPKVIIQDHLSNINTSDPLSPVCSHVVCKVFGWIFIYSPLGMNECWKYKARLRLSLWLWLCEGTTRGKYFLIRLILSEKNHLNNFKMALLKLNKLILLFLVHQRRRLREWMYYSDHFSLSLCMLHLLQPQVTFT